MIEIELEKTYLIKYLPNEFVDFPFKEIKDIYIPKDTEHPILRIRKFGDEYEITKKQPIQGLDSSEQYENTIPLTREEFLVLEKIPSKKSSKIRYYYNYEKIKAEVDVFQDELFGLVTVDFEFKDKKDKDNFKMPEFCLVDITQDKCFAGGMICGKKYIDIEKHLNELNYKKIN